MTRRAAIALLTPPRWTPPGVDRAAWRHALAEDVADLLVALAEVDPALAVVEPDLALAEAVRWPSMRVYRLPSPTLAATFTAAADDGYDQAVVLAADAPDLPGMLVGKLLRPLTTRAAAAAPASGGRGLLGVATRLPPPSWLAGADLDTSTVDDLRAAARSFAAATSPAGPTDSALGVAPAWSRLTDPASLAHLDPAVEGWEATRALLSAR